MNEGKSPEQQRAEQVETALNKILEKVRQKANEYQTLAAAQRQKYSIAKAIGVVLGVLTPTFIAFQTQHATLLTQQAVQTAQSGGHPVSTGWSMLFSIIAICLTAGTGIVTGLQASFKWGEGYSRSAMAAQQLEDLADSVELASLIHRTTPDLQLKYDQLKRLADSTRETMQKIIEAHSQSDITNVKREAELQPPEAASANAVTKS